MNEIDLQQSNALLANSVKTAAARTGLSVNYLRACISDGRLPAVRFGRTLRIREADLIEFVRLGAGAARGDSQGRQ